MSLIRPKRGPSRLTTCTNPELEKLRRQVVNELEHLSVECAPEDAQYLVWAADAGLPSAYRLIFTGAGVSVAVDSDAKTITVTIP